MTGAGSVTLCGTNVSQGGIVVSQGTLIVADPSALAASSSLAVGVGAAQLFASPSGATAATVMAAAPLVVASPAGATVAAEATSAASSGGTGVATVPIAAPDLFQSPLPSLPGAFPRSLLRVVHGAGIDRAAAPLVAGDLAWPGRRPIVRTTRTSIVGRIRRSSPWRPSLPNTADDEPSPAARSTAATTASP